MAELTLVTESKPATPSAGVLLAFAESQGKRLTFIDDAGKTYTVASGVANQATAAQTGFAADTYLAGSNILVPASLTLQAGTIYRCKISLSKTAAGLAAPTYIVRVGTAGTTADTAVLTFTGAAQTGVADVGYAEIFTTWRSVGASGVLQGTFAMVHNTGAATGLIGAVSPVIEVTGGAFSTTTPSLIMGVSVNGGASASYTVTQVQAEMLGI